MFNLSKARVLSSLIFALVFVLGWHSQCFAQEIKGLKANFFIKSVYTNKCLDIPNGSSANGIEIIQWECKNQTNQIWEITSLGDGYYKISSTTSGKSLEVVNGSYKEDSKIAQRDYTGKTHQQWKLIPTGKGYYKIQARHSNFVLDIPNGDAKDGVKIIQFKDNGQENQMWQLTLIP